MKKHICIILPKLTHGGTERTAAVFANYLAKKEQNVSVILMYKNELHYNLLPGVRLIQPPDLKKKIGKFLYVPYVVWFIRKNIKKIKPDSVLALGYISLTLFASMGVSTKVIISGRSSPARVRFPKNPLLNKIYYAAKNLLRGRVDGVIAQTTLAAEKHRKKHHKPVVVIPNFLREITPNSQKRENWIINVGRFSKEKGQEYLIEAFSKVNAPDWKLVLVGDGPAKKLLEKKAEALKIKSRTIFAGFQQDVDYYLSKSKIYALPSLIEGFPNSLIEAMANELAPVCFNCQAGPADIIRHGKNGLLIKVKDTEAMSQSLQLLIDDSHFRKKIAKRAKLDSAQYDLEVIGKRYFDFIITPDENPSD